MEILAIDLNFIHLGYNIQYAQCSTFKNHIKAPSALLTTRTALDRVMNARRVSVAPTISTAIGASNYAAYSYPINPVTSQPLVSPCPESS